MKTSLVILGALLTATPVFSQQTFRTAASAASAGFSAERLHRIDSFFQAAVDRGLAPNAVTFIARKGQIVHHKAFGFSNLEKRTPARTDDIFRIASQTKLITTVAVLMLYEEGRLFLDDPISKFLPEFKDVQVMDGNGGTRAPKTQPTIRHLLSHSAGIPYQHPTAKEPNTYLSDLNGLTLEELIKQVAKRPLVHEPGEAFTYGYNTDVAGRIVEVISGKSLKDFFHERILKPLGMNDTYFYLPPAKAGRLVELYAKGHIDSPLTVHGSLANRTYPVAGKQTLYLGGGAGQHCCRLCQNLPTRPQWG